MNDHKFTEMLEELEEAAKDLQDCLLSRDTDRIWGALAQQEETMTTVGSVFNEQSERFKSVIDNSPALQQLLKRSQTIVRTNRTLTQRFLNVIDQTFAKMGRGPDHAYGGYGGASRVAPLLVSQQG
jgi:hypothetical protein